MLVETFKDCFFVNLEPYSSITIVLAQALLFHFLDLHCFKQHSVPVLHELPFDLQSLQGFICFFVRAGD
jgi:hypothetical protein